MNENTHPSYRMYGRRKGRPLHTNKARLMEELLPKVMISLTGDCQQTAQELVEVEPGTNVWLEIGFGGGEHLAAQAKLHPDIRFIGCEPFINGVAGLLSHIERDRLTSIRVFNNDARMLLDTLKDACLDRCFLLFADPWPKKKHAERRFIGSENLDRLARVMKPGAVLRLASDHPSLVEWMRECLSTRSDFTCVYAGGEPPSDWVETRYQQKAIAAGRVPFFMDYRRNS